MISFKNSDINYFTLREKIEGILLDFGELYGNLCIMQE